MSTKHGSSGMPRTLRRRKAIEQPQLMIDPKVRVLIDSTSAGLRSPDPEVAARAREALVAIGPVVIPALREAMVHHARDARMAIARRLGLEEGWENGDPLAFAAVDYEMLRVLKRGASNPCLPAATTLARLGEGGATALLDYVQNGKGWLGREAAIIALGQVADRRAKPVLKKAIRFWGRDRVSVAARRAIRAIDRRVGTGTVAAPLSLDLTTDGRVVDRAVVG